MNKHTKHIGRHHHGFTIVELLIVIVVIGILASLAIISFSGIQARADDTGRKADISSVAKALEMYKATNGSYPVTTNEATANGATGVLTDSNCDVGAQLVEWVPGLIPGIVSQLPQSDGDRPYGTGSGCYRYWSNGENYILSAWGAAESGPHDEDMYRRVGFGATGDTDPGAYYCNDTTAVGGGSPYNVEADLYQHSYTVSNITTCDETHPTEQQSEEPPAEDDSGSSGQVIDGVFVPQHVLDAIAENYPGYEIYRVDDDGGEYEIRVANGDDEYRFEYNGDWELVEIDH